MALCHGMPPPSSFLQVVVEFGATPYLVALLTSPSADVREQCAWCLGNIAGDCPELRDVVLRADVSRRHDGRWTIEERRRRWW